MGMWTVHPPVAGSGQAKGRLPSKCWPRLAARAGHLSHQGHALVSGLLISSSRDSHRAAHPQGQRGAVLGQWRDTAFISASRWNGHVAPRRHDRFSQQHVLSAP